MKKTLVVLFFTGLSFGSAAQQQGFVTPGGQEHSAGGFQGQTRAPVTVAQARTLRDDAWVVLEGNIVQQTGHERYEFRDSSGTIQVDIDDKYWRGQTVSPATKLRIEGEVDKDWNNTEIDVKNFQILR